MHSLSCRAAGTLCCTGTAIHPGRRPRFLSYSVFPPSVVSAHPNVPPLQTAALTDSACPSSPWQRGRDRQSVTDCLCTWQSRRVQLEWNYCLLCSVCNGTSVARFPIHTPSGFPPLQQLSAPKQYPLWHYLKKVSFSAVALFLPFPVLCLSLFLPPHILWKGQGEAFVSTAAKCTCAGCSVWVACCSSLHGVLFRILHL